MSETECARARRICRTGPRRVSCTTGSARFFATTRCWKTGYTNETTRTLHSYRLAAGAAGHPRRRQRSGRGPDRFHRLSRRFSGSPSIGRGQRPDSYLPRGSRRPRLAVLVVPADRRAHTGTAGHAESQRQCKTLPQRAAIGGQLVPAAAGRDQRGQRVLVPDAETRACRRRNRRLSL